MENIIYKLDELEKVIKKQIISSKEFFTLEEASEYLQLSKSCLYKMTSKKQITFYNPGGKKIYFKKEDLLEWISKSINISVEGVHIESELYVARNLNATKK